MQYIVWLYQNFSVKKPMQTWNFLLTAASRSTSPSSRLSYLTHQQQQQQQGTGPPTSYNNRPARRSGIPRSQGASRETSPNRFHGKEHNTEANIQTSPRSWTSFSLYHCWIILKISSNLWMIFWVILLADTDKKKMSVKAWPRINSYSASRDNWCTVGGDGGCRVGEVRAGITSPMPDHKVLSYSN